MSGFDSVSSGSLVQLSMRTELSIKNDPGIVDLVERVYKGHLSAEKMKNVDAVNGMPQGQLDLHYAAISEGEEAEQRVISYVDWLQTATNPRPLGGDNRPEVPDPHPCSVDMTKVISDPEKRESQYIELCNCVQKHICRVDGYCKSTKKKGNFYRSFQIKCTINVD